MKTHIIVFATALMLVSLSSFTVPETGPVRNITIAGIVVDAATMQPLASVEIDDAKGQKFGSTDKNGYYKIIFEYRGTGEVKLGLKTKRTGYKQFIQKEHWGNLPDGIAAFFYFGLQKSNSAALPFCILGKNTTDNKALAYNSVLAKFGAVRDQVAFANKMEAAKKGNENLLVQVSGKFYLVNNSGWIPLGSDADMVSVDNKKPVPANQLNKLIKRKKIKSMSTVAATDHKVAIFTAVNTNK